MPPLGKQPVCTCGHSRIKHRQILTKDNYIDYWRECKVKECKCKIFKWEHEKQIYKTELKLTNKILKILTNKKRRIKTDKKIVCAECGKKLTYNDKALRNTLCGKCQLIKMDKIWAGISDLI